MTESPRSAASLDHVPSASPGARVEAKRGKPAMKTQAPPSGGEETLASEAGMIHDPSADPSDLSNKSVIKAAALLYELGHYPQGINVTDLAKSVALSRPTAFRLLLSLEQSGFVERIDNRYRLGWKIARLGRLADPYTGLRRHLQPLMKTLADQVRETIGYAIVHEPPQLDLIAEEIPQTRMIRISDGYVGRDFPLHASGMGKLVLAELPDAQIVDLYSEDLPRFASRTLTRRSDLLHALAQVRAQGFAVVDDELEDSHYALAVPVRDMHKRLVGALAITGPGQRIKAHAQDDLLAAMHQGAQAIADLLAGNGT